MKKSNLIKDSATRNAVRDLEVFVESLTNIKPLAVPATADDTTRLIIQSINKIIDSFKRRR